MCLLQAERGMEWPPARAHPSWAGLLLVQALLPHAVACCPAWLASLASRPLGPLVGLAARWLLPWPGPLARLRVRKSYIC